MYDVSVRDAEGNPIVAGKLDCQANEDRQTGFSFELEDGRATFVGNLRLSLTQRSQRNAGTCID
jgi:hypothetical protein